MSPSVEPFNEAKYKDLMDGLECSEIRFSQIDLGDRFDSDYYTKNFLHISDQMSKVSTEKLGKLATTVASAFYPAATQLYSEGDTAFARCVDCVSHPVITKDQDVKFEKIPYSFGKENKGISFIKTTDIVITKVGTPCYASILTDYEEIALSRTVMGLTGIHGIDPFYLMVFLRCKYGFEQLFRQRELTIQYQLTLPRVKAVDVFLANDKLQKAMKRLCEESKKLLKESNESYQQAEQTLVEIVKCPDISALSAYSIKTINESFALSGRLDAEYYQPKYEAIAQKLNTRETVLSLCNLHDKNFNPDEEKTYQYIELADVGQSGDISDVDTQYGIDLPTRARRIVKAGQIIVSSVEGSLQSCALITDGYDGALCSTGFYVLDSDIINSETLLVLFKSEPIQALMKQRCSGTILTAISKDELLSMPLPMIDENVQKAIAAKVQESFALRKKSKQLLEHAKQAVEMAIEQGEDAALEWLKDKFNEEV